MRPPTIATLTAVALALTVVAAADALPARKSHHVVSPHGEPMNLALRLVDLPPGYEVTSDYPEADGDGACYRSVEHSRGIEESRYPYVECSIGFGESWHPPGSSRPRDVKSVVLAFDNEAHAKEAFGDRWMLAYDLFEDTGDVRTDTRTPTPLGDDARIRAWSFVDLASALVVWRSGRVVSYLQVGYGERATIEQTALAFARRQQARVASPTPLVASDNDDTEVPLDSPQLEVGVRWLGRDYAPGGSLPPLRLVESTWIYSWDEGPDWSAQLLYGTRNGMVVISLWRPSMWAKYKRGVIGKRVLRSSCARRRRLATPFGKAILYSTLDKRGARCKRGDPASCSPPSI